MAHLLVISLTAAIFGVTSLLLISRARNRLSEGSIRRYMDNFAICLAFIVIFSIWQTVRGFVGADLFVERQSHFLTFPEYIFIVFAYIAFIIASFRVTGISEEFGFKEEGKKIKRLLQEKASLKARAAAAKTKKPRKSR